MYMYAVQKSGRSFADWRVLLAYKACMSCINIQTSSTLDCMGKIHICKHTQKHSGNKALRQSFWLYLPPVHRSLLKEALKSEFQNLLFCVLRRKPSQVLSVFYYSICAFLCPCRSFNSSLCNLSPFLLSYVTVSRLCSL